MTYKKRKAQSEVKLYIKIEEYEGAKYWLAYKQEGSAEDFKNHKITIATKKDISDVYFYENKSNKRIPSVDLCSVGNTAKSVVELCASSLNLVVDTKADTEALKKLAEEYNLKNPETKLTLIFDHEKEKKEETIVVEKNGFKVKIWEDCIGINFQYLKIPLYRRVFDEEKRKRISFIDIVLGNKPEVRRNIFFFPGSGKHWDYKIHKIPNGYSLTLKSTKKIFEEALEHAPEFLDYSVFETNQQRALPKTFTLTCNETGESKIFCTKEELEKLKTSNKKFEEENYNLKKENKELKEKIKKIKELTNTK